MGAINFFKNIIGSLPNPLKASFSGKPLFRKRSSENSASGTSGLAKSNSPVDDAGKPITERQVVVTFSFFDSLPEDRKLSEWIDARSKDPEDMMRGVEALAKEASVEARANYMHQLGGKSLDLKVRERIADILLKGLTKDDRRSIIVSLLNNSDSEVREIGLEILRRNDFAFFTSNPTNSISNFHVLTEFQNHIQQLKRQYENAATVYDRLRLLNTIASYQDPACTQFVKDELAKMQSKDLPNPEAYTEREWKEMKQLISSMLSKIDENDPRLSQITTVLLNHIQEISDPAIRLSLLMVVAKKEGRIYDGILKDVETIAASDDINNPAILDLLRSITSDIFKEANAPGTGDASNRAALLNARLLLSRKLFPDFGLSPNDANESTNIIFGDLKHAFMFREENRYVIDVLVSLILQAKQEGIKGESDALIQEVIEAHEFSSYDLAEDVYHFLTLLYFREHKIESPTVDDVKNAQNWARERLLKEANRLINVAENPTTDAESTANAKSKAQEMVTFLEALDKQLKSR